MQSYNLSNTRNCKSQLVEGISPNLALAKLAEIKI